VQVTLFPYTEPAVRTGKVTSNGRQYDNQETFHFISRNRCEVNMTHVLGYNDMKKIFCDVINECCYNQGA